MEYMGAFSALKYGTVQDPAVSGGYVQVRWDDQHYGSGRTSGLYPTNLRIMSKAAQPAPEPATEKAVSPELGFAANLRKLAGDNREKARAYNRVADKAEALARELEGAASE